MCPHVCALYTSLHTGYVNSVYKTVLFINNIHVYARYMDIIQYTVTGVLHVGPATLQSSPAHGVSVYKPCTCIVTMDSTHVCTCHVQSKHAHKVCAFYMPLWKSLCRGHVWRAMLQRACAGRWRLCPHIHACAQRGRAKPLACASPWGPHDTCARQTRTCTCGAHGPSPWYTHHVLCMWLACIHGMRWASGKHSMLGPCRTHACTHHGNTCAHGRPEAPPPGACTGGRRAGEEPQGPGRQWGTGCSLQPSGALRQLGWSGPASSFLQSTRGISSSISDPTFTESCPDQG